MRLIAFELCLDTDTAGQPSGSSALMHLIVFTCVGWSGTVFALCANKMIACHPWKNVQEHVARGST